MPKGYTLIEFLVVLGLLAIAVGAALLFLTSILKGTNQANISAEVKQNGQAILDSLERQIRGAKSATNLASLPVGSSGGVVLLGGDNSNFYLACFSPTASLNGAIKTATQVLGGPVPTASDYKTISNTDTVSGTNITSCSITASAPTSSLSGDIVVVSFTADRAVKAPTRADFNASANFMTTISLRKY
ncbi:hypothetical protein A2870_03665 [Candidatus Curtissbacteria bacterium RIFCSPHIGHO2_01_FULL_41_11]|uniref:Prepilin-type N-terminal cleavage/methylation domain-containing protein n=1 Tax=Candidatus Curtissbacteria bacterium RIFCSPHIGHO2_01_FULL_41_11 TaxID=1797711 RepID=A0A1F5G5V0_9BACT|nr:MAG: hypothetical protein A2870_03665 [Candidatus Curtissbacteria bacterium RIFCSPHIGHO2_01_FULL_41_11]